MDDPQIYISIISAAFAIGGIVAGGAFGYGIHRARLAALEKAHADFRKSVEREIKRIDEQTQWILQKFQYLKGRGILDTTEFRRRSKT